MATSSGNHIDDIEVSKDDSRDTPTKPTVTHIGDGDSDVAKELTLEGLLAMTPIVHGVDVVRNAARDLFLSCVKSQHNIHDVFFSDHVPHALEDKVDHDWFEFDKFACLYVCQVSPRHLFYEKLHMNENIYFRQHIVQDSSMENFLIFTIKTTCL